MFLSKQGEKDKFRPGSKFVQYCVNGVLGLGLWLWLGLG